MTRDLIQRAGISGDGRLLDLACGTGQLAFPLRHWFSEVWAVDRERDMVQDGTFPETMSFAYDLARKPGP